MRIFLPYTILALVATLTAIICCFVEGESDLTLKRNLHNGAASTTGGFSRNKRAMRLTDTEREELKQRRQLQEDNEFLNDLEDWKHAWNFLHVVVFPNNPVVVPQVQTGLGPGQILASNADVNNIRGNQVGRAKQACIRSTNFVCTWTVFSASITKSGCDIMLQGIFVPTDPLTSFGVPVDQFAAIVGGTGPCRGITGEVKISPRSLAFPTEYDFEFYYIIRG